MAASKSQSTYFKEEVEKLIFTRYKTLSAYETIGALEVVKANLLDSLSKLPSNDNGEEDRCCPDVGQP